MHAPAIVHRPVDLFCDGTCEVHTGEIVADSGNNIGLSAAITKAMGLPHPTHAANGAHSDRVRSLPAAANGQATSTSTNQEKTGSAPIDHDATAAFADFYRQHASFVRADLRRRNIPDSAIDDVAQEVFVTAHRKRHTLHGEHASRSWLGTISRYCAANFTRSRQRRTARESAFGTTVASRVEASDAERLLSRALLRRVLLALDAGKREVWVLTEAYGMTVPEICSHLALSPTTVRSRLYGARRRLRQIVDELDASHAGRLEHSITYLLREETGSVRREPTLATLLPVAPAWFLSANSVVERPLDAAVSRASVPASSSVCPSIVGRLRSWRAIGWTLAGTAAAVSAVAWLLGPPAAATAARTGPLANDLPGTIEPRESGSPPDSFGSEDADWRVSQRGAEAHESSVAPSTLGEELELVQPAVAAYQRGEHSRGLEFVARHASRFPAGQLASTRALLHVQLLCGLDRVVDAEAIAASYRQDLTTSPLMPRPSADLCRAVASPRPR